MSNDGDSSNNILQDAASKDKDQPGEVRPAGQPREKQPTDAEADGSDRENSDG